MPCNEGDERGRIRPFDFWQNWARTRHYTVPEIVEPTSLKELVNAVVKVERSGGTLKAMGSGWSYTDAAVSSEVTTLINTDSLNRILNGTSAEDESSIIPYALIESEFIPADKLIHVEAGIKIHDLNCRLHERNTKLAMPTLGGSNGQSLAGVLSTATHGGDVNLPPIQDAVKAIHLVGPGGLEWWIERSGDRSITNPARMEELREADKLCHDLSLEYDDELFAAVLVSMGRMGVIYSLVIEAESAFMLCETTEQTNWSVMESRIRTEIFDNDSDYERSDFLEVVINPYENEAGDHDCVVTERWRTDMDTEPDNPDGADIFELFCNLEELRPLLLNLSGLLPGLIATAASAAIGSVGWIPIFGGLLVPGAVTAATATLVALQTVVFRALASPRGDLGSMLMEVMNLAVQVGQKQLVRDMTNIMMRELRPVGQTRTDWSYKISTGQKDCPEPREPSPACMRVVDGIEYAFNATRGHEEFFNFIDDVFRLTDEFFKTDKPAGFGMSLRFTRGSEALLAMQQYSRNCHAEFMFMRGLANNPEFIRRLHRLADRHGGIPHWGLLHQLNQAQVARLYGEKHTRWRRQLMRLLSPTVSEGTARTRTFSTSFSIDRDLEPLPGCIIPRPLINFFRRILVALSRADGMRDLDHGRRG